jgi:hypothetical protein
MSLLSQWYIGWCDGNHSSKLVGRFLSLLSKVGWSSRPTVMFSRISCNRKHQSRNFIGLVAPVRCDLANIRSCHWWYEDTKMERWKLIARLQRHIQRIPNKSRLDYHEICCTCINVTISIFRSDRSTAMLSNWLTKFKFKLYLLYLMKYSILYWLKYNKCVYGGGTDKEKKEG